MNRSGSDSSLLTSGDEKTEVGKSSGKPPAGPSGAYAHPYYAHPGATSAAPNASNSAPMPIPMPYPMYEALMAASRQAFGGGAPGSPSTPDTAAATAAANAAAAMAQMAAGMHHPMGFMDPRFVAVCDHAAGMGSAGMWPGYSIPATPPSSSEWAAGANIPSTPPHAGKEGDGEGPGEEGPNPALAATWANGKLHRPKPLIPKVISIVSENGKASEEPAGATSTAAPPGSPPRGRAWGPGWSMAGLAPSLVLSSPPSASQPSTRPRWPPPARRLAGDRPWPAARRAHHLLQWVGQVPSPPLPFSLRGTTRSEAGGGAEDESCFFGKHG